MDQLLKPTEGMEVEMIDLIKKVKTHPSGESEEVDFQLVNFTSVFFYRTTELPPNSKK